MDIHDVPSSRAEATRSLLQMREENILTDLDLECAGSQGCELISVHSVLLAARSNYFKALLSEPWCTPVHGTRRVTSLAHMSIDVVHIIVHCVYTGYLGIDEENMNEVLLACWELDFQVFAHCAAQVWL
jgi:hypothetical protein